MVKRVSMGVDPGGGGGWGDISPPPNILGGGMACIIIPPPPIFHGWMSYYTDKISEVPTIIMKEIAGFECRNVKIFLARSARSHTYRLSRCGRLAGSLWGVYSAMSLVGKLHRMYTCNKVTSNMQTKFVSTNSNIERNRSFGTYKCENFQARSLCSLAHLDFLDVHV